MRLRPHRHICGPWYLNYTADGSLVRQIRVCQVSTCCKAEIETH